MKQSLEPNRAIKTEPQGLHDLYVTWAMQHLIVIQECLEQMERSNFNWMTVNLAIYNARTHLLQTDAAYQEAAWRILAGQEPLGETVEPVGDSQ